MRSRPIIATLLCLALAVSCSIKQGVTLDKGGRATVRIEYAVVPAVADTMISLMNLNGDSNAASSKNLFKVDEIKKGFEKNKHITLNSLSAPTRTSLKGEFVYDDFEQAFKPDDPKKAALVLFDHSATQSTVRIHIAKDTISQVAAIFPEDQRSYIDIFSPPAVEGTEMSEAEYLDMLKSLFGDTVVPDAKKSTVELTFTPAGKVISQTGGVLRGNSVVFSIPLLKILVLEKPLDYSVTYQN